MSHNIVSRTNHIEEVKCNLTNQQIDLLALNGTRLDNYRNDDLFSIKGSEFLRKDRNRQGGGVAVCVRNSINYHW